MINKKDFMLLMERMEKRHSHEESMVLVERSLLTEAFSKTFLNRLVNGITFKSPQILRTIDVMTPDGISLKKIDNALETVDDANLKGIKSLKAELAARRFELNDLELDGLENYFKSLDAIRMAARSKGSNSVISIINKFDDTNLNLKQKKDYVRELFDDNPDLVNLGMPDGQKLREIGLDSQISKAVEDNFLSLGNQSFQNLLTAKTYNRFFSSYKKALKDMDLDPGDLVVTHPDKNGMVFIVKSGDATSEVRKMLEHKGYVVDSPNTPIKSTMKGKNGTEGLEVLTTKTGFLHKQAKFYSVLKILFGLNLAAKIIGVMADCYFNVRGKPKRYYDWEKEKHVDKGEWSLKDCLFDIRVDPTLEGDMDKTKWFSSNMLIRAAQVIIPSGMWWPWESMTKIVDWNSRFAEGQNRGYKIMKNLVEESTKNLTIKEILSHDCEVNINLAMEKVMGLLGSNGKIMNALLNKVTGLGVDPADIANEMNGALDEFNADKDKLTKWTEEYSLEINGINAKLPNKYKLKNGGFKEKLKLYCYGLKAKAIADKLEKFTEYTDKEVCKKLSFILDFYSKDGYDVGDDIDAEDFSVENCGDTKKGIEELAKVREVQIDGDFSFNLDVIKCDEGDLGDLLNDYKTYCLTKIPTKEEKAALDSLGLDSLSIKLIKVDTSVDYYVWENIQDPLTCYDIAISWQSKVSQMKNDNNLGLLDPLYASGDVKVKNGKLVFKLNEKTIRTMEGSDEYSTYCNFYARNSVISKENGKDVTIKKTQPECVDALIDHLENSDTIGCWGEFYG